MPSDRENCLETINVIVSLILRLNYKTLISNILSEFALDSRTANTKAASKMI